MASGRSTTRPDRGVVGSIARVVVLAAVGVVVGAIASLAAATSMDALV